MLASQIIMYDIYVTNKTAGNVYVRLHPKELTSLNGCFHRDLTDAATDESYLQTFLIRWGFVLIPSHKTLSFNVGIQRDYDETCHIFASLYANSKLWVMDKEVDYINFGCLFVRRCVSISEDVSYFSQENPQPVWLPAKKGDALPPTHSIIRIDNGLVEGDIYCGRYYEGVPCHVTSINGLCDKWIRGDGELRESGALLKTNGHQWLRALSGDPVPPNSVIAGFSDTEGSLYLGRIGGNRRCSISSERGKIKHFSYFWCGEEKRIQNGELLVLTNDGS